MDETEQLLNRLFDNYPDAVIERCFGVYYIELDDDREKHDKSIKEAAKKVLENDK